MKTMQDCNEVRRLFYVEHLKVQEISRQVGMDPRTVKRILDTGGPPEYQRRSEPRKSVLGPFTAIIDEILKQDTKAPRKQRHTAKRIHDRLCDEYHYPGGYTQVREYVAQAQLRCREAFIPLEFGPGEAQVDWGVAIALDATGEPPEKKSIHPRKVNLFVLTLPYSGARFVAAFPRQTRDFFLEGHQMAFEYFNGVPHRIVYDNLKSAVVKVLQGKKREINPTFKKFSEQYLFEPAFCNVACGNEKGNVENGVKWTQRNLFVPIPKFSNWDTLNIYCAEGCRKQDNHTIRGKSKSVGQLLEEELAHFLPLPGKLTMHKPMEPQKVDSLCLVSFDGNHYSAPCQYAYHEIVVRPTVGKVDIYRNDCLIAQHQRCYGRRKTVYDPLHYLALIERKPRALDYAAAMKGLELAPCFEILRRRLEAGQIHSRGTREYIRVLRLLENHSLAELTRAVGHAIELGVDRFEAVKSLLLLPPEKVPSLMDLRGRGFLAAYRVIATPVAQYSELVNIN